MILKELCSFTFKLGMNKIAQKSWWEAVEVVIEGLTIKMICFERKCRLIISLLNTTASQRIWSWRCSQSAKKSSEISHRLSHNMEVKEPNMKQYIIGLLFFFIWKFNPLYLLHIIINTTFCIMDLDEFINLTLNNKKQVYILY
jgi:hypothetical protein